MPQLRLGEVKLIKNFWKTQQKVRTIKTNLFDFLKYLTVLGLSCSTQTLGCGVWDLVPWPETEPRLIAKADVIINNVIVSHV